MKHKAKKKSNNPLLRMPLPSLWILCFPTAIIAYGRFEGKTAAKKREAKRRLKEERFLQQYPEFVFWQDNEDL